MNYITLFLKNFVTQPEQPRITQDDVEFVINERLKEKTRLEKTLKILRWQATSQLGEIKNLYATILEKQNEKKSLIKKIELLNLEYSKVLESYNAEKERLLILEDKLANLDSERLKIDAYNKQIKLLENEFEVLKQNISKENEELKRLRNEKLVLIRNKVKYNPAPVKKQIKDLTKKKKSTRCTGKTKSNHRCKNYTTDKTGCCNVHKHLIAPKRKIKIVNFNS
jgi:DNA repair exonuclease SbcCD ATPase subunit